MAPSLFSLKGLRRRSKASFQTERSTDTSSEEVSVSNGTTPTSGSSTPPSLSHKSDDTLSTSIKDTIPGAQIQQRTLTHNVRKKRTSMMNMGPSSTNSSKTNLSLSPYTPRIANFIDGSWVGYMPHLSSCIVTPSIALCHQFIVLGIKD